MPCSSFTAGTNQTSIYPYLRACCGCYARFELICHCAGRASSRGQLGSRALRMFGRQAILEDLVYPTEVVGKRVRYRADASKILKVHRWAAGDALRSVQPQCTCNRMHAAGNGVHTSLQHAAGGAVCRGRDARGFASFSRSATCLCCDCRFCARTRRAAPGVGSRQALRYQQRG